MKIEKNKCRRSRCSFGNLRAGEAFSFPNEDDLFMRTADIHEGRIAYNCVRLEDGAMFSVENSSKVEKRDARIIQNGG